MKCRRFEDDFAARVADGDEALEAHLGECLSCRREAEEVRRTLRALGPAESPASPGLADGVWRALEAERARRARTWWRLPAVTGALAAAAVLLALLGRAHRPSVAPARGHVEEALGDDDPCELIGELTPDELQRVQAHLGGGV
jgi:hypothetical protein